MEDDYNSGFSWALFFCFKLRNATEYCLRERRPTIRRWLGASCAAALICAGVSMPAALAQTSSAASKTATSKTKSQAASNKTAGSSKKSAKDTTVSTSASKTHNATAAHRKSNTTLTARNSKGRHTSSGKSSKKKTTARGQQKIDPERAQEIQEALIREHYLSGEAAETWNQASEEAMRRYQADHGWQSKTVPDSRALISLGLGPSHDHLLNPESAMVTGPFPTHSATLTPVSHSASPGAQGSVPSTNPPATTQSSDANTSRPQ
jgi:hypothetical protein